jgi:hypothetical protein
MMQPTDLWGSNNFASGRLAHGPDLWTILVAREMRPRATIVLKARRQGAAQVMLIEHDKVIETLTQPPEYLLLSPIEIGTPRYAA